VLVLCRYLFHLDNDTYYTVYTISAKTEFSFLLRILAGKGPFTNFDLMFCFFVIKIPEFVLNLMVELSKCPALKHERTIQDRVISPLIEYLYLNPLYSSLGGSTILAVVLTKKPG
jgi:hypothetical protein